MGSILLDTTVLIDLLRGRAGAIQQLRKVRGDGDVPYVCAVNVEETARGLRASEAEGAHALFSGLRVAPLAQREGWQAGTWRRDFASDGVTLSQADCLVGAAALSIGGRLATGNPRDFPMTELDVEHWAVGA